MGKAGPSEKRNDSQAFSVTRRKSTTILLAILLAISVGIACIILRSFWRPIIFAAVIGIGFYPLHERVSRRVRRPNLSALLSTLLVLLIFLIPCFLLASIASSEITRAAQHIGSAAGPGLGVFPTVIHYANRGVVWLGQYVDLQKTGLQSAIDNLPARISRALFTLATSFVKGFASLVVQGVITLFILFFVFRDAPSIRKLAAFLPLETKRRDLLYARVRDSVFANLYGMLAVALVQGILTGVAFAVLGIPSPVLLGILAALFSLVPFVGPALVWLPASVFLFVTHHWIKALILLGWGAFVVGTADNVVRPLVIMGRVKLHPLVLLFGLIGGVQQFGFVGLFIGPAIMSLIFALFDALREDLGWTQTRPEPDVESSIQ